MRGMNEPHAAQRAWYRRRFRFSLRTLFVVVTMAALFLAWRAYCLDWIRQRHEWINNPAPMRLHAQGHFRPPPWYLLLFGEKQGWEVISMRLAPWTEPEPELTPEELVQYHRIQRLFPEAIISTTPNAGGWSLKNLRVVK